MTHVRRCSGLLAIPAVLACVTALTGRAAAGPIRRPQFPLGRTIPQQASPNSLSERDPIYLRPVAGNGLGPRVSAFNPKSKRLYILNQTTRNLSVLDTVTEKVVSVISLAEFKEQGNSIRSIAVDAEANRIYVPLPADDRLAIIDGETNKLESVAIDRTTFREFPVAVTVDAATGRIYVANQQDRSISILDGVTKTIRKHVTLSIAPVSLTFDPSLKRVYAAGTGVAVLNAETEAVMGTVPTSASSALAVDATRGRLYVAAVDGVAVINTATNARIGTIAGVQAESVRVDSGTGRVHAINKHTVFALDPLRGAIVSMRSFLGSELSSIELAGDGLAYITDFASHTVRVVEVAETSLRSSIRIGSQPHSLELSKATGNLYVADGGYAYRIVRDRMPLDEVAIGLPRVFAVANASADGGVDEIYIPSASSSRLIIIDAITGRTVGSIGDLRGVPNDVEVDSTLDIVRISIPEQDLVQNVEGQRRLLRDPFVARRPYDVAINSRTGDFYVASGRSESAQNRILKFDVNGRQVATITIPVTGANLVRRLVVDELRDIVYAIGPKFVARIQGNDNSVTFVAGEYSYIDVNESLGHVYVAQASSLQVLDGSNLSNLGSLSVGSGINIQGLTVDGRTNTVYVSTDDGTVRVIEDKDATSPTLRNVRANPLKLGRLGGVIDVRVEATDDAGVKFVRAEVTDPAGAATVHGLSRESGDTFRVSLSFAENTSSVPATYRIRLLAEDVTANATTSDVLTVTVAPLDTTAPTLANPTLSSTELPGSGETVILSIEAQDANGVAAVQAVVTGPDGKREVVALENTPAGGVIWRGRFKAPANPGSSASIYHVSFTATDTAENQADIIDAATFRVAPSNDITAPVLSEPRVTPDDLGSAGGRVAFSVLAVDDVRVESVVAELTLPDGEKETIPLRAAAGSTYSGFYDAPANTSGRPKSYQVVLRATDASGLATATGPIQFTVAPAFDAGGRIALSPTKLTFTSTAVGKAARPKILTVRNSGKGPLILSIEWTAPFSVSRAEVNGNPVNADNTIELAAGQRLNLTVEFQPLQKGPVEGEITIESSDPRKEFSVVRLTGKGK